MSRAGIFFDNITIFGQIDISWNGQNCFEDNWIKLKKTESSSSLKVPYGILGVRLTWLTVSDASTEVAVVVSLTPYCSQTGFCKGKKKRLNCTPYSQVQTSIWMRRFLKVEYHTLQVKQKIFLLCLQQIKNKEPNVKKKNRNLESLN